LKEEVPLAKFLPPFFVWDVPEKERDKAAGIRLFDDREGPYGMVESEMLTARSVENKRVSWNSLFQFPSTPALARASLRAPSIFLTSTVFFFKELNLPERSGWCFDPHPYVEKPVKSSI